MQVGLGAPGKGEYYAVLYTKKMSGEETAKAHAGASQAEKEAQQAEAVRRRMDKQMEAEARRNACPECQGEFHRCRAGNASPWARPLVRSGYSCAQIFNQCLRRKIYADRATCKLPR